MFKALMICALIGLAAASPVGPVRSDDANADVVSLKNEVNPDGFENSLETTNQIRQVASGDAAGNIHGNFGWVSPEGEHVDITYVANENGYQPQGALLPTPPPTPAAIERLLEWIAAHPQAPEH